VAHHHHDRSPWCAADIRTVVRKSNPTGCWYVLVTTDYGTWCLKHAVNEGSAVRLLGWMMQPPERLTDGQTDMFQLTKAPRAPSETETENVLTLILSQQIGRGVQPDPKSKAREISSHLSEAWAVCAPKTSEEQNFGLTHLLMNTTSCVLKPGALKIKQNTN